jgi:mismatch-specific thymine-DNA glycosylase
MKESNHKIIISVNGKEVETLADILPQNEELNILFIAKTPAPVSVNAGHYFQGTQGRMFWNKLANYNILKVPYGEYEDDYLLENSYGITDIVKVPRSYGNEPSNEEYKEGLNRILDLMKAYKPKVICFVYKKVLDQVLKYGFHKNIKSDYGYNPDLEKDFGTKVFVFPMPGTPCKSDLAHSSMLSLKQLLNK